jgi:hypothetical protein
MKDLPNFLPPQDSPLRINKSKVKRFIEKFNEQIQKNEYTLNDALDGYEEELNDLEFELAKNQADRNGYILTKIDDEHNSITYKLEPKPLIHGN